MSDTEIEIIENDNIVEETKQCTKCKKEQNIKCFENLRTHRLTKTCTNCRAICYKSYKLNDGFGKKDIMTKNEKIEYLYNIINTELHGKRLKKYDKLSKIKK